jgi:EAL domain-containing protein (putative c-di-GMP-specific phosphodiesterase class I)/GGDEF domain-containing protein
MKTLRIVILEEDDAIAHPARAASDPTNAAASTPFAGLDPRTLEGLNGPAVAELLRQHAMPMSFLDTDAGGLDEAEAASTSLEDRLQEALRSDIPGSAPIPLLLVPPREDTLAAGAGAARPQAHERFGDSLMRVLRRHELEAALTDADTRLRQIGLRDARHGLPRRELFLDRLEQATISVQRGGVSFTLLMIGAELPAELGGTADMGLEAGEPAPAAQPASTLLIEAVSARLQRQGRRSDSYARIGGHSFAALMLGNNSVAASMGLAHRLAEDLARPVMVAGRPIQPVITIGVVLCPQHGGDARNLMLHAHAALEQAQAGRHVVAVYDPRYSRALHNSQGDGGALTMPLQGEALAPLLVQALERRELGIALQPVVDLTSGRITEIEALARWQLPDQGPVATREFIAVAEQHGLIAQLTDLVLDQALAAARHWRTAGLEAGLALNLSVRLLADRDWPTRLRNALERHDCPAQRLTLEVSAPALMQHADADVQVLAELTALGVKLAVDDFGNGLTSFLAVTELGEIAQIKIDLAALRQDARATRPEHLRAILGAAVALAHGLGARVVVKGVEDGADLAALHELGVDGLQGRVCAAPMAARQVRSWWAAARQRPLAWQHADTPGGTAALDILLDAGAPYP